MKKNASVILAFCLLVISLTAQEKVAIIPFTGGNGDEGNAIAQILKAEFAELGNFQIAPHTQAMDTILEDKNIQKTGIADGDTMAKLGKGASAEYVVSGHIQSFGRKKILLSRIIHIKTFRQIAGDYYEYTKFEEVINYLPTLAEKLVSKTKTDYLSLPTLAILPFQSAIEEKATGLKGFFARLSSSKKDDNNADFLVQLLAIEIANSGKYAVISRERTIANIMEEQNIKVNDLADINRATKLGKEINTQYVLSGTVSPLSDDYLINVTITEVLSLVQEAGAYARYKKIEEGIRLMLVLSSELTGVLSETTLSLSLEETIAIYDGNKEIETIKKLVAKDINATNSKNSNFTSLMYASRHGYTEIVKALIVAGANIEAKDKDGRTALMRAAINGRTGVVKILIEESAKVNTKDNDGNTALIWAVKNRYSETVKILVKENANLDIKDNDGYAALSWANYGKYTDIANLLKKAGANTDVKPVVSGRRNNFDFRWVWVILGTLLAWSLIGAAIFGFYYLMYKRTIKKKGSIQSTSFIVREPRIIGWFNLFAIVLFIVNGLLQYSSTLAIILAFYCAIGLIPISISTIVISFLEYKKAFITSKRLRNIVLLNIINIILILLLLVIFIIIIL